MDPFSHAGFHDVHPGFPIRPVLFPVNPECPGGMETAQMAGITALFHEDAQIREKEQG